MNTSTINRLREGIQQVYRQLEGYVASREKLNAAIERGEATPPDPADAWFAASMVIAEAADSLEDLLT